MVIAVTADMVGSRELADRAGAQERLDAAIARVEADAPWAETPLTPTVGDEQQGQYATLDAALAATLLLRLALPEDLDLRFGLGIGDTTEIPAKGGPLREGPAWWAAREAIERVHALAQRRAPAARTWVVGAPGQDDVSDAAIRLANAYLLARDELLGVMSARTRRITYARCLGRTQREIAATEGVSQSAVSQAIRSAGAAAIVEGFEALAAPASE